MHTRCVAAAASGFKRRGPVEGSKSNPTPTCADLIRAPLRADLIRFAPRSLNPLELEIHLEIPLALEVCLEAPVLPQRRRRGGV